jgi:hypothetical protein
VISCNYFAYLFNVLERKETRQEQRVGGKRIKRVNRSRKERRIKVRRAE